MTIKEGAPEIPRCDFYDFATQSCTAKHTHRFETHGISCSQCEFYNKSGADIENQRRENIRKSINIGLSFIAAGAIIAGLYLTLKEKEQKT